ncbi:MAG: hypothetical protein KBD27_03155 [Candidatus Moranbacteria bacterium]|nr:hypothetical protein [Candidatus Moranbacteria bacterium]
MIKEHEKEKAILLRKQGLSYNEILRVVPVAKSTLSVWLKDIGLAKAHKQRLTEKRKQAQQKAQQACRDIRITREAEIIKTAQQEIGKINRREFWLIGSALYWAEGSKQKPNLVSQKVSFNNSDPKMILLFDKWIKEFCERNSDSLIYSIYIHTTGDVERAKKFWSELLKTPIEKVYFKKGNPKTNRKNIQNFYYGLLRIEARKSTDLNRKIKGWNLGITNGLGI